MDGRTDGAGLERLGANVRAALDERPGRAEALRLGRAAVLARLHAQPTRRTVKGWAFVTAGAVAATGLVTWLAARPEAQLSATLAGTTLPVVPGAALDSGAVPLAVAFSDRSALVLSPASRVRVAETGTTRARVVLEHGEAQLAVRKHPVRRWSVEAGPFRIAVLGTRFHVRWTPSDRRFSLAMDEGSVTVEAPCLRDGPRRLEAGQRLDLTCPEKVPGTFAPAPEGKVPGTFAPPPAAPPPAPLPGRSGAPPRQVPGTFSAWRGPLAAGRFGEAVREAERIGLDAVTADADAAELLELGDAARLAGRPLTAVRVLHRLRQRYGKTPQASRAAFSLGRLAFEQQHRYDLAAEHFARYLAEDPSGPLIGDAWGRLLEARQRAGQTAEAKRDALIYLQRFPSGPYAALARALAAH